jgi:protocatechuate 3,4-dioxygenase beta subunit
VPNAVVEIWHTNRTGGYSGKIAAMCNNDQADLDKQFFRGFQRTDANGRVDFDTCYPGWYHGRAVHVHLRVMAGAYDGGDRAASAVTTQLLFTDALNHEIFTTHPLYRQYGEPDTTLDRDGVIGAEADKAPYLFDVKRMDDGVMFVSKTLVVRRSDDEQVCEAQGILPPGGPGGPGGQPPGPPPDGFGPPPGAPPDGAPPPSSGA